MVVCHNCLLSCDLIFSLSLFFFLSLVGTAVISGFAFIRLAFFTFFSFFFKEASLCTYESCFYLNVNVFSKACQRGLFWRGDGFCQSFFCFPYNGSHLLYLFLSFFFTFIHMAHDTGTNSTACQFLC